MQKDIKYIEWLLEEKYRGQENGLFHEDVERLKSGEPLAYVIGHIPFLGCTIYLDNHPLIPRVETEYWVDLAINEMRLKHSDEQVSVLDIFSGSGCIGVGVKKNIPRSSVTFSEIDPELLPTIKKNISLNLESTNTTLVLQSNVFSSIEGRFNYIFANPPYISESKIDEVETSVQDHEPELALYAPNDGLELIFVVLREAPNYLEKNGIVYMEIGYDQQNAIEEFLEKNLEGTYRTVEFLLDQYEGTRVVKLTL